MEDALGSPLGAMFDSLAASEDDIEGLLAFAYYQRHKRAWAQRFAAERGRIPSAPEELAFVDSVCVPDQLQRYRSEAQGALVAYGAVCVAEAREEIAREAITTRMEMAVEVVEASGALPAQVKASVVSTLLTTAILVLLAAGVRLMGIDLLDAMENIVPHG